MHGGVIDCELQDNDFMGRAKLARPRRSVGRPTAEDVQKIDEAILKSAALVFREKGFDGASMQEIADRASASRQTLYARYRNKTVLYEALMERRARELLSFASNVFDQPGSASQVLFTFGLHIATLFITSDLQVLHQMVIAEARTFPGLARIFFEKGPDRGQKLLQQYLSRQVEFGTLSIENIERASEQLMGAILGPIVFRSTLSQPSPLRTPRDLEEWVRQAVDVFMAAYTARGQRSRRSASDTASSGPPR